jgi:hypothetical protein
MKRFQAFISLSVLLVSTVVFQAFSQAQTFTLLHTFTGGADGAEPYAGLTIDRGGNLYGTALGGGCGNGTVFKIIHKNGAWIFNPLYCFTGGSDGNAPVARVVIGPDGSLYGTTQFGGGNGCSGSEGCGTVFRLRPPITVCKTTLCPWGETVLYRFQGNSDGANPGYGDLVFDQAGNIYGTTREGGGGGCSGNGCGVAFELTPSHGGQWTESIVYRFTSGQDGAGPVGGVIVDSSNNLYGTTEAAGTFGGGTVFQLTHSGTGWMETTLYAFNPNMGDGYGPAASLIFDSSGNLYGTSVIGGSLAGGTVFELTTAGGGGWAETILHPFASSGDGPSGSLIFDSAGNVYGTTYGSGANDLGNVFKLTHSNGSWDYVSLHDFTGPSDGKGLYGNVVLDTSGNVYGTASLGGSQGLGVVWAITP